MRALLVLALGVLPPYGDAQLLGRLSLPEVSGLAAATRSDTLFVHEDSGNGPRFARVDRTGRLLQSYRLPVQNRDWEDMAAAPDAQGRPSLWFGDLGDNRERREQVQVHRVGEPGGTQAGPVQTYRFTYADGPHDAEALMVLPGGRQVAVVTKSLTGAGVYTAPLDPSAVQVLRRVTDLPLLLVTGAAISPDGRRVALRTYTDLYEWRLGDDLARTFAGPATRTPLPPAQQGEAVAYDRDGSAVLVASEGQNAPLQRLARLPQAPSPQAPSTPPAAPPSGAPPSGAPGSPAATAGSRSALPSAAVAAAVLGPLLLAGLLLAKRSRRRRGG